MRTDEKTTHIFELYITELQNKISSMSFLFLVVSPKAFSTLDIHKRNGNTLIRKHNIGVVERGDKDVKKGADKI